MHTGNWWLSPTHQTHGDGVQIVPTRGDGVQIAPVELTQKAINPEVSKVVSLHFWTLAQDEKQKSAACSITDYGKENRENVSTKMRKKVISPQKSKEMRAKNLAVKWEKENSYQREEEKKTDNKIKKRGHKSE